MLALSKKLKRLTLTRGTLKSALEKRDAGSISSVGRIC